LTAPPLISTCVFKDEVNESTTDHEKNVGWKNNLCNFENVVKSGIHQANDNRFQKNGLNWSLHLLSVYIIKMSQGAMIAGAFILVVVCCSSSSAMLMMGGDEKKTTTPTTSTTPTTPAPTDTCVGGSVCPSKLTSPSGACVAVMQDDGNYVVYDSAGTAIWDSKTMGRGTGPYRITMQSDGNFVLYDSADTALWNSTTAGRGTGPYKAVMQDDCNLVVYGSGDQPTWSSKGGLVS
jgi:hypothetical protein